MVPIAVPKTSLTSRFRFVARLAGDPVISSLPTAVSIMLLPLCRSSGILEALYLPSFNKQFGMGLPPFACSRALVLALRWPMLTWFLPLFGDAIAMTEAEEGWSKEHWR